MQIATGILCSVHESPTDREQQKLGLAASDARWGNVHRVSYRRDSTVSLWTSASHPPPHQHRYYLYLTQIFVKKSYSEKF